VTTIWDGQEALTVEHAVTVSARTDGVAFGDSHGGANTSTAAGYVLAEREFMTSFYLVIRGATVEHVGVGLYVELSEGAVADVGNRPMNLATAAVGPNVHPAVVDADAAALL
jgi:hypothetical protein